MNGLEKMRVFTNSYKTSDTHPDFTGKGIEAFGEKMDVAVWKNQDKNGNDYLNIQLEPAYEKDEASEPSKKAEVAEELPF